MVVGRKEEVVEKAREIIDEGRKPSARMIAQELDWREEDVHSCLNALEKEREVSTYSRDVLGEKHRLVGIRR